MILALRIGDEPGEWSRPRLRRRAHRIADDAARDEVGVAVVIERDDLRRRTGRALELDPHRRRIFLAAVARSEGVFSGLGTRARRRRDFVERLRRLDLPAKQRYADYADLVR